MWGGPSPPGEGELVSPEQWEEMEDVAVGMRNPPDAPGSSEDPFISAFSIRCES